MSAHIPAKTANAVDLRVRVQLSTKPTKAQVAELIELVATELDTPRVYTDNNLSFEVRGHFVSKLTEQTQKAVRL